MSRRAAEQKGGRTKAAKYIPTPMSRHFIIFDNSISRSQRVGFYMACVAALPSTEASWDVVEPRLIADPMHPAFGQFGLFAKVKIPSQTTIMCYGGFVQHHGSFPCSQAYTMGYGGFNEDLEIDSEFIGNLARFANDPRGCPGSPMANVVAQTKHTRLGETYAAIITKRLINAGEELLLGYGPKHRLAGHSWTTRGGPQVTRMRAMPPEPLSTVNNLNVTFWWQCAQCGSWTQHVMSPLVVSLCGNCNAPRAARAPMCALDDEAVKKLRSAAAASNDAVAAPPPAKHHRTEATAVEDNVEAPQQREPLTIDYPATAVQLAIQPKPLDPPFSLPSAWPLDFPFVTWQLWDTHVPHSTILAYSHFSCQSTIAIIEDVTTGRSGVTVNADTAKGGKVAAVGGLLVHADDERVHEAPLAFHLYDLCEGVEDVGDGVVPPMVYLASNETSLIQKAIQLSDANCRAVMMRDPLGFLWVALIATRDLSIDEELIVWAPPLRSEPLEAVV